MLGGLERGWPEQSHARSGLGLTHSDLRHGNAIWDGRWVVMIEVDEPVYGPLATDLARKVTEVPWRQLAGRIVAWDISGGADLNGEYGSQSRLAWCPQAFE